MKCKHVHILEPVPGIAHKTRTLRVLLAVFTVMVIGFAAGPRSASATIFFDWVCNSQNTAGQCSADPALALSIGFKDSEVAPGASFTGADNGIDSLSFTSGIGDGFTITLDHMVVDRTNLFIQFDALANEVLRLEDAGADTLVWFGLGASGAPGWLRFRESHTSISLPNDIFPYDINGRWDRQGVLANSSTPIGGKFVRRIVYIPEPTTMILMSLGLAGFGLVRNRRV